MDVLERNNVRVFGRGEQPMLFAHGFGCDQKMWRFITPAFLDRYKIILFDHVGSGNSAKSAYHKEKYDSLKGYATDILDICQELALENVVFVGHSVGAMMGILSAIQEPAVFKDLILVGPSPCYINDEDYTGGFTRSDVEAMLGFMEKDYEGWAETFASFIMGNPGHPSLSEELANSFCNTNPEIARHFAEVSFLSDNRADLVKVQPPSLILQCFNDMIAPDEVGEYMHQNLKNSTLVKMKATGHCPNLSAPLETIAAIDRYLRN
ncbi:alpha/beta fold hydrolase [Pontibacter sp. SGAir0037]|uniref:alpha/beta fold hydrolase n=1 Tax=Pontibacter sp. SGAir0037 TaxID=2571030 RepID=UPI0010CD6B5D|nr:alpha/beta hydrolase [Pontibacter sp. SGAir0037]QCR21905.1 alpha/beta hydrolase [Pontibacter sp. SGAir0037]